MIYPTDRHIIEYFAEMPAEVKDEFRPLLEDAQCQYRRVWQLDPGEQARIDVLSAFAATVFRTRAAKRLRPRSGSFSAFQAAISLDGGDAEFSCWYAHWLYHTVEKGRMLRIWQRQIELTLGERIREAENLWYTPDLVPEGWREFLTYPPIDSAPGRSGGQDAARHAGTGAGPHAASLFSTDAHVEPAAESRWADLEICFLSDERVQIRTPGKSETRNYAEMGFADGRNGKPSMGWQMLRFLATNKGSVGSGRQAGMRWTNVEKRAQEIRKRLRQLHSAPGDPLPFIKKNQRGGKVSGYEAQFRICCGPAYRS